MSNEYYSKKDIKRFARKVLLPIFGILAMIFIVAPLLGFFVQFLWNATIADIFDLKEIGFWQAVGLFILAKFLFGFGGSSSSNKSKSSKKHRNGPPSGDEGFKAYWKNEGKDAWEAFQAGKSEGDLRPEV